MPCKKDLIDWYISHLLTEDFYFAFKYTNKHVEEWFTFYNQNIQLSEARESVSRPCMQFNKLVPIIRSLCKEEKQTLSPEKNEVKDAV